MSSPPATPATPRRRKYVPVVGPRLKKLLFVVFGLFALLAVNAAYLGGVTFLEWSTGRTYQNWFYLIMFLLHLVLGALFVLPVVAFGVAHIKNAYNRPNRRAVRVGLMLFTTALVLLVSGIVLTRIEGVIVIKNPTTRSLAYWAHVVSPLVAAWLFVLHRLAGRRIKWKIGLRWAAVAAVFAGGLVILQAQDPRRWNVQGPASGERYFFPSLARTATGNFIPEQALNNDSYCQRCHPDIHDKWMHSMHHFSSFSNAPYLTSVTETRKVSLERDGERQASRWCAGCHDPVVFFTGKFDDKRFDFDDPRLVEKEPAARAGVTCAVCHSITNVNSVRGNADYTIDEPIQYPFAFSRSRTLRWINEQLIKAKPAFHKKTYLKPFHKTAEFCSTCHKVHLPVELNKYKWLRGQDHYDAYLLSGVSGHGVTSFYYPPKAVPNCSQCHMPLMRSDDFGARFFDDSGALEVHDHLFPGANTAIPQLVGMPDSVIAEQEKFNQGVMRVDLFGVKEGGTIDGELTAPIRPQVPALVPGRSYLLEAVIRTVKMGHLFTQGTIDSNEVWMDVTVSSGGRVIGRSGGLGPARAVDPWSHFVNGYVLDRFGKRIDRRNAQDIFVALYNHQIPPGAADVIHYRLDLPRDVAAPVTVDVKLQYRKFDTTYMKIVDKAVLHTPGEYVNDLPIMTLAADHVTFPVAAGAPPPANPDSPIEEWQRWNDYGIGLLLKGGSTKGELRQAEDAFTHVEQLGHADGPLNLARVYIAQGTVETKAIEALHRAAAFQPPAPSWSIAWFTGEVNKQNGFLDQAIANYQSIVDADDEETRRRGFDFSKDYRLLDELGQTLVERSKEERGEARKARRDELLEEARGDFERALVLDPENVPAHYNLDFIYRQLGDQEKAAAHFALYQKYKPDDNARDRAVAIARRADPAADHAAEAIVLYDLRRPGAYELGESPAASGPRRVAERRVPGAPGASPSAAPGAPGAPQSGAGAGGME